MFDSLAFENDPAADGTLARPDYTERPVDAGAAGPSWRVVDAGPLIRATACRVARERAGEPGVPEAWKVGQPPGGRILRPEGLSRHVAGGRDRSVGCAPSARCPPTRHARGVAPIA